MSVAVLLGVGVVVEVLEGIKNVGVALGIADGKIVDVFVGVVDGCVVNVIVVIGVGI